MRGEQRIEIEFRPLRKVVVFEVTQLSFDEFLKRAQLIASAASLSGQLITLSWAEGILFIPVPYQVASERMVEDMLKGTVYYALIVYAAMPEYKPEVTFGALQIQIVNQSSISSWTQIAKWLKQREKNMQEI